VSYSLAQIRRALAQMLGGFANGTVLGGSNVAPNAKVISPALLQGTINEPDAYAGAWVYFPAMTGTRQQRVLHNGLDPATGTLTLEGILGGVPTLGDQFEIHTHLPATRMTSIGIETSPIPGLHEIINEALRLILIPDTLTISVVDGIYDLQFPGYAWWLDRPSRLLDVRELNVSGTTRTSTWRRWQFRPSATAPVLHVEPPFRTPAGSSVELAVVRPADSKVAVGGAWTDALVGAPGLRSETDGAYPDLNAITTIALALCYRTLRDIRAGSERAVYGALYEQQLASARLVHGYDHSNDIDPAQMAASAAERPVPEVAA
jgi:hypothetical protein